MAKIDIHRGSFAPVLEKEKIRIRLILMPDMTTERIVEVKKHY
jgi:hypothetical protein